PPPQLVVVAVGAEGFADRRLEIPFAAQDARALAEFAANPGLANRPRFVNPQTTVLAGRAATAKAVADAFAALDPRRRDGTLRSGDTVVVAVAAHLLAFDGVPAFATSDSAEGSPLRPTFPARELAEVLGRLAAHGCTVMLWLDAAHPSTPQPWGAPHDEWVRGLWRD